MGYAREGSNPSVVALFIMGINIYYGVYLRVLDIFLERGFGF